MSNFSITNLKKVKIENMLNYLNKSLTKILICLLFSTTTIFSAENDNKVYEQLNVFGEAFDRINEMYVEEVDVERLIQSAINGMLNSLDPHSGFLPPRSYEDMQIDTKGSFGGLGIEVTQEEGFVKVVSPMDDTPAFRAGVEAGDYITHIDGEPILGLSLSEAVEKMRGPVGEKIVITIVRVSEDEPFDVTIVRDTIKLVAARVRYEENVVIMRVSTFNEQTTPNLKDGVKKVLQENNGMRNVNGFILDLRNNPGGLLSEAVSVSDLFLNEGEIVSTRGRTDSDMDRFTASKGDLAEGLPLIVLINGGSASASEIVAGALQDQSRAILVGTKTFGKGSVQTIIPLVGDVAMRLTTARYFTPSGRSIQAMGVSPDIIVEPQSPVSKEDLEEMKKGRERLKEIDLRGALSNENLTDDEKNLIETERERREIIAERRRNDFQLAHALDLIKGLTKMSINE
ncbi:MAG: S41 family peptidase [Paracoccaceae bacterium]